MVSADKLEVDKPYKLYDQSIGTYVKKDKMKNTPGHDQPALPTGAPEFVPVYYFTGCPTKKVGYHGVGEKLLVDVVEDAPDATCNIQGGRRRRRTRRMMFKKWAAQEAREMSHKGKRMTFRKWAAHELKEKSHPGNPSFKKWARQEMREKSHTRRRR